MKKILLFLLVIIPLFHIGCKRELQNNRQVLLVLNSGNPESMKSRQYLMPYLNHFDIPYDTLDVTGKNPPKHLQRYSLIILAHRDISQGHASLGKWKDELAIAAREGTGIVSFDPEFFEGRSSESLAVNADTLVFTAGSHYITAYHKQDNRLRLFDNLHFLAHENISGAVLISAKEAPFLWTGEPAAGRIVNWASDEWMKTRILGPLGGLDDCLWRSMVWAARKPFVMRGLPPLVTMRVDDVAGRGELWGKSPLYWIKTCNNYGFKPWLGLFIYNLNPLAVNELRGYITSGGASASPHAFGRPPRSQKGKLDLKGYADGDEHDFYAGFYYNPNALPLRETEYDEFIYFDHQHFKPWSDPEAKRGLDAVDQWYEENQSLPKSTYFIAHWYEMGANVIGQVSENWGMEFIAQNKAIDRPWHDTVPWVKQGPFRLHEEPGTSTNNPALELRGINPVYYADFTDINGFRFFNCYTEIRDDAGYEWAPDNDVEATAGRGIRQLTRAMNSMAMAVLFTHETDYIYRIRPENWDKELHMIAEGIKSYNPIYLSSDDALKIVRATRTSRIQDIGYSSDEHVIRISFAGTSDVSTSFWLFGERQSEITQELIGIPAFDKDTVVTINTSL